MKLQIFVFRVSDAIAANVQNISALVYLHILFNFMIKELSTKFYGVFNHSAMNLRRFE